MSFEPLTQPVDHILLAGHRSPGIAVVTGAAASRQWDERKGFARSGARVVYKGNGLAKFTVTLQLFSAEDWKDWHAWRPLVQRTPAGERARAKDIWHPILEDLEVSSAVVEEVGQPVQNEAGDWSIAIKFIEYRAPMPALTGIEGSDETPRPQSAEELLLGANAAELQALTSGQSNAEAARARRAYVQRNAGAVAP